MATTEESSSSPLPLQSIDEIKLPSLTALKETKKCPKCQYFTKNGIDIHSTLAYSRCRCHRDWKYENQNYQLKWQQSQNNDTTTNRISQIRSYSRNTTKRCLSAMIHSQRGIGGTMTQQPDKLVAAVTMDQPRKVIKLKYIPPQKKNVSLIAISNNDHTISEKSSTCDHSDTSSSSPVALIPNSTTPTVMRLPQCNSISSATSSVTKLPSIVANVSPSTVIRKHSPLQAINKSMRPIIRKSTQDKKVKKQQNFEFTHLLKYIPLSMKQKALEIFGKLDVDGDGHLSYSEVVNGLIGDTDNCSAKAILESYLKPIYHLLGDTTYFGKRDFVLCYNIAKLLREHRLPKILYSQSTDFYEKTMKPLMSLMYSSATEEGTIPIFVIEDLVQEFSQTADTKLVFRKFKVTNLIEEDGLLSLINTFILAPFLFEIV